MKQLLTIKGIFNDVFTDYKDKESSYSIIVDIEEECECFQHFKCAICKLVETGTLSDLTTPTIKNHSK